MTLRAATLLAENSGAVLERIVAGLREAGIDIRAGSSADGADVLYACGLLTMQLIERGEPLEIVAAPVPPGEARAVYRSVVVARRDAACRSIRDACRLRVAVNEYGSWSGWEALVHAAGAPPADRLISGSHLASIRSVADGGADVAAIDSTVWDWAGETGLDLGALRVVATTRDWPAPPISVSTELTADVRERVVAALTAQPGVEPADAAAYEPMLELARR